MDYRSLDLAGCNTPDGTFGSRLLQDADRDVVAIELAPASRMGGRHGGTVGREQEPLEQRRGLGSGPHRPLAGALGQDGMDPVPELPVDDRLMLAGIRFPLVDGFTDVDAVTDY